jgi:hypothetical protein
MGFRRETIPAFLSIDVEPDAFQISPQLTDHWPGYAATFAFLTSLRAELTRASGAKPIFGWYYRMDPQIEEVCGRADFAITAYPRRAEALCAEGDYFGVHTHPLRWCGERKLWVHDFADREWLRESTQFGLDAFAACSSEPAKLFRAGAGFLTDDIVDVLDRNGVLVESSLEPGAGWGLRTNNVQSGIDKSPMIGEYTNCATAPRTPYHPSHASFLQADEDAGRRILIIPVTTGAGTLRSRGLVVGIKRRLGLDHRSESAADPVRVLYPTEDDWTERGFWDLIEQQLRSMERPYLSLGIRTDRFDSRRSSRVCRVFHELVRHPLVKRLRFVDPLQVMDRIAPRRAEAGHAGVVSAARGTPADRVAAAH